jgi:hypothetical protein
MATNAKASPVTKPEDLMSMTQAQLDELYRNSSLGDIPVGGTHGTAIVMPESFLGKIATRLIRMLIWRGKVFNPSQGDLKNKISPFELKSIRAMVYVGDSWLVKGQQAIVIDYSKTSLLARKVRDEIRQVAPGLYLGKVFWGHKHVLDFCLTIDQ